MANAPHHPSTEWFARPDAADREYTGSGLRFSCTQCGNCCSGPPGYILFTDAEAEALAGHLRLTVAEFLKHFTHKTTVDGGVKARSLNEKRSDAGLDCIFLDRASKPGKAICSVYQHRPAQCRTWPFWPSALRSKASWQRLKKTCPGIDTGPRHDLVQIRVQRDACDI